MGLFDGFRLPSFSLPSFSLPGWLTGKKNVSEPSTNGQGPAPTIAPATGAQVPATGVQGGGGSRRRRRGSRASRRKAVKGGSQGYMRHNVGELRRAGGGKHRRCSKKNHTHCRHK